MADKIDFISIVSTPQENLLRFMATAKRLKKQRKETGQNDPLAKGKVLVCVYEKEDEFRQNDLEGAISLADFRKRMKVLPKDENIIFYCACPHDEAATREAQKYYREGFMNSRILQGGVHAWKDAGYGLIAPLSRKRERGRG